MDAVFWSTAFASKDVVVIPALGVLMLQPTPLQCNTALADWQFDPTAASPNDTSQKWRSVVDGSSGLSVIEMPDSTAGRAFSAISLFDITEAACFYVNIYRGEASIDAARSPADYYTVVTIADGTLGGLVLNLPYGAAPSLQLCVGFDDNNVAQFVEVARCADQIPDCEQYLAQQADRTWRIRVLSVPSEGAVVVDIGQGDATMVVQLDGYAVSQGPLTVYGQNGVTRIQYLPMRWAPLGSILSSIRDHMTAIQNTPQASLDAVQDGHSLLAYIEAEVLLGTSTRYAVTLDATAAVDGSGLAVSTPLVRSASLFVPGVTYNDWVANEFDLNMRRVQERMVFDLGSLSFSASARITCDNHDGLWTGSSGIRAAALDAGIDGDNWRRLTGLVTEVELTHDGPTREATFTLLGREYWLKRKAIGVHEPFDDWDIYGVFRWLCNRAGITDYWCQGIPYTPFGRGQDTPYYHLPIGTGTTGALFQFDPRTSCWEAMLQIAKKIRAFVGFDAFGFFRCYRWDPTNFGPWKQAFQTVPAEYNGTLLYNQIKQTMQSKVNVENVRSDIILGSIDPFTRLPVFAGYHNEDVVTNLANWNFIGGDDVEIEISDMLFDPILQDVTLATLAEQSALPSLTVGFAAYFQHRLFPLDVVTVREPFCLGGLQPFWVETMDSTYGVNARSHFGQTELSGHWLYNE